MSDVINTQPRLFAGSKEELNVDAETMARIHRLDSLQRSIERRPDLYQRIFFELGEEATTETLDIHDDAVETRTATSDPRKRIQEYFAKRDDKELQLDDESAEAIYGSEEFMRLSRISQDKRSFLRKTGVMQSELVVNPAAREASNAVRRYILGEYLGRVVLFDTQHTSKKVKQAG